MRRPGLQPGTGIVQIDTTAELQPTRIDFERRARWLLIAGSQEDDMPPR